MILGGKPPGKVGRRRNQKQQVERLAVFVFVSFWHNIDWPLAVNTISGNAWTSFCALPQTENIADTKRCCFVLFQILGWWDSSLTLGMTNKKAVLIKFVILKELATEESYPNIYYITCCLTAKYPPGNNSLEGVFYVFDINCRGRCPHRPV